MSLKFSDPPFKVDKNFPLAVEFNHYIEYQSKSSHNMVYINIRPYNGLALRKHDNV